MTKDGLAGNINCNDWAECTQQRLVTFHTICRLFSYLDWGPPTSQRMRQVSSLPTEVLTGARPISCSYKPKSVVGDHALARPCGRQGQNL